MKKILSLALILIALTLLLTLASCDKKHEHTPITLEAVAPTCLTTGLTEGQQCSECGEILVAQTIVKTLEHKWSDMIVLIEATQDDKGEFYRYCKLCNSIEKGELLETRSEGLVISNGSVKVGTCTATEIEIPAYYNDPKTGEIKPVTKIDKEAFLDCRNITVIRLPDTIETIGDGAFENCKALREIILPESVKKIGASAFKGCESLETLNIPQNVKKIEASTFEGCVSLDDVVLSGSIEEIGADAFKDCVSLETVEILGSLKQISKGTFEGCSALANITIPADVTSIGENAFKGCVSLDDIVLPTGVKAFGANAFNGATNALTSLVFIEGTTIGEGAFAGCRSLKSLTFNGDIPEYVYSDITNLNTIIITDGITEIRDEEFIGCKSLVNVTIPDSVVTIGENAFYGCDDISYTEINGNKYLGDGRILMHVDKNSVAFDFEADTQIIYSEAFNGCCKLLSVEIPDSIIHIGYGAFNGCSALESITVPYIGTTPNAADVKGGKTTPYAVFGSVFGSDEYVGAYAVAQHCEDDLWTVCYVPQTLKTVKVSSGIIPTNAFRSCSSVEYVELGAGVGSIYDYAFYYCTSLLEVNFDDNAIIYSIGNSAFASCASLESVVIPETVRSIDESAFKNCVSLVKVEFEDGIKLEKLAERLFAGCSSLYDIILPESLVTIGDSAFYNCSALKSINVPSNVEMIGAKAFGGCKALASVVFANTNGWFKTFIYEATYGDNFNMADLADPATAANYLNNFYCQYVWKR